VRRHPVEQSGKPIAKRSPHLLDLIGRPVERAADHQKHPLGLPPARLLGKDLSGRTAEHHRLHFAEDNAARLQHGLSSHRPVALPTTGIILTGADPSSGSA
jgi:hypothetical protein